MTQDSKPGEQSPNPTSSRPAAGQVNEQASISEQANLTALLENASNFVVYQVRLDPQEPFGAKVVLVSPSVREITGVDQPYRFESWFENIHPDDRERAIQANRIAMERGEPYDQTVRVYHPHKKAWIWLHTVSNPVYDQSGRLTHYNGLIVDVTERKLAEESLQRQLAFEYLLTNISANFVNLAPEEVDQGIERALQILGEFVHADRAYVFLFSPDGTRMSNTHEWCAPGIEPQKHRLQDQPVSQLPWFTRQIQRLSVVHIPDVHRLPAAAQKDREAFLERGAQSLALVPMIFKDTAAGFIGFETLRTPGEWPEEQVALLQIIGEIMISAVERKRAYDELQENRLLLEEQSRARERETASLLDLSYNLAITINLEPKLDLILDQLKIVVDYTGASILRLEGDTLKVVAYRGPIPQEEASQITFSLESAHPNRAVIETRQPVIIADVLDDTPLAADFRLSAGDRLHTTFGYLRSWMGVPLVAGDQVIGMLSLDHPTPGYYQTVPHSKLALAFAYQVAAAIENARLYAEVRQRADEAQAMFSVQQAITSRLERNTVLQMIADEALRLTATRQAAVYLLDEDELEIAVVAGEAAPGLIGYRLPLQGSVAGEAIQTGKTYLIQDASADPRVTAGFIHLAQIRSFIIAPLMAGNGPIGAITVADKLDGELNPEDERVLTMLASGAVVALENARFYAEEQERRREADRRRLVAEGLRDVLQVLNSNRPLGEVLDSIVVQACQLLEAASTLIRHADRQQERLRTVASCNLPPDFDAIRETPLYYTQTQQSLMARKPVAIPDLRATLEPLLAHPNWLDKARRARAEAALKHFRSTLEVPIFIQDEIYGSLIFYFAEPRQFTDEDIHLAMMVGDQAALAIENAHLRAQVEQRAVVTERNRLARDLHDAVTQTLFSATLIAEVLPRLWERNPEEGRRRLDELRQLTRGALAEMRSLLLELRPTALVEAEISELFRHLADAFTGRARVPVQFSIEGDTPLPPEVKVALYRISQEALNNVAKHADASQVWMNIRCVPDEIHLSIEDNGRGFDPLNVSHEHLGLGIMEERAEQIGAKLDVISSVGKGTRVQAMWRRPG